MQPYCLDSVKLDTTVFEHLNSFVFELHGHSQRLEIGVSAKVIVKARVAQSLKDEASTILAAMGLTISDAVRMMLTRVVREQALPFDRFIPNAETIAAMKEAREGKAKRFDSVEALMADLNSED
jgi:DNA-damage-inducible protein J